MTHSAVVSRLVARFPFRSAAASQRLAQDELDLDVDAAQFVIRPFLDRVIDVLPDPQREGFALSHDQSAVQRPSIHDRRRSMFAAKHHQEVDMISLRCQGVSPVSWRIGVNPASSPHGLRQQLPLVAGECHRACSPDFAAARTPYPPGGRWPFCSFWPGSSAHLHRERLRRRRRTEPFTASPWQHRATLAANRHCSVAR